MIALGRRAVSLIEWYTCAGTEIRASIHTHERDFGAISVT